MQRKIIISTLITFFVFIAIHSYAGNNDTAIDRIKQKQENILIMETKQNLERITLGLDLYEMEIGKYPERLNALLIKPDASTDEEWNGPYIEKNVEFLDAWGNPYIYHYPAKSKGNNYYDLSSAGPDGTNETDDDISLSAGPITIIKTAQKQETTDEQIKNLKVIGIIPLDDNEFKALIETTDGQKTYYLKEGDSLKDFRINLITTDSVILSKDGKEYTIKPD